jgi:hypothetical protein
MNAMSKRTEERMATKMISLGVPSSISLYKNSRRDVQKYAIGNNENDCISCQKHTTGKIPNNIRCNAVCGTPVYEKLKKRVLLVKDKSRLSKEEIREILAMSKLIQQTEQHPTYLHYE